MITNNIGFKKLAIYTFNPVTMNSTFVASFTAWDAPTTSRCPMTISIPKVIRDNLNLSQQLYRETRQMLHRLEVAREFQASDGTHYVIHRERIHCK